MEHIHDPLQSTHVENHNYMENHMGIDTQYENAKSCTFKQLFEGACSQYVIFRQNNEKLAALLFFVAFAVVVVSIYFTIWAILHIWLDTCGEMPLYICTIFPTIGISILLFLALAIFEQTIVNNY